MNYRLGAGCRTSIGNGIRTRWWDREAYNVMVTRRDGNSAGRTKVTAQNVTTRPFGFFHILLFAGVIAIVLLLMPFVLAAYPLIVLSHILVFSIACLGLNGPGYYPGYAYAYEPSYAYVAPAYPYPAPAYGYVYAPPPTCWNSTSNSRNFGYYGSCAYGAMDDDAESLGQARPNRRLVR